MKDSIFENNENRADPQLCTIAMKDRKRTYSKTQILVKHKFIIYHHNQLILKMLII